MIKSVVYLAMHVDMAEECVSVCTCERETPEGLADRAGSFVVERFEKMFEENEKGACVHPTRQVRMPHNSTA